MTTHTAPLVSIERPSSNLTIVTIGTDLEFAFSYTTIVAFRAPTNPASSWIKSRNVWSQTTGKHLNQLPGETIDHDEFNAMLKRAVFSLDFDSMPNLESPAPPPVGEDGQGPTVPSGSPADRDDAGTYWTGFTS